MGFVSSLVFFRIFEIVICEDRFLPLALALQIPLESVTCQDFSKSHWRIYALASGSCWGSVFGHRMGDAFPTMCIAKGAELSLMKPDQCMGLAFRLHVYSYTSENECHCLQ